MEVADYTISWRTGQIPASIFPLGSKPRMETILYK
jgi:hypothetical protein